MGTTGVVVITEESFSAFYPEARDLIARHAAELNPHDDIPLNINEPLYVAAEMRGMIKTYVARIDGIIVGYAIYIVDTALNWMQSLQAQQTAFFVDPNYRVSTIGTRLLRLSEEALEKLGVQMVLQQQFTKHPALGRLLEHEGYEQSSIVWQKRLDKKGHLNG
jgi:GNAT superfamily N-acetyltransferase